MAILMWTEGVQGFDTLPYFSEGFKHFKPPTRYCIYDKHVKREAEYMTCFHFYLVYWNIWYTTWKTTPSFFGRRLNHHVAVGMAIFKSSPKATEDAIKHRPWAEPRYDWRIQTFWALGWLQLGDLFQKPSRNFGLPLEIIASTASILFGASPGLWVFCFGNTAPRCRATRHFGPGAGEGCRCSGWRDAREAEGSQGAGGRWIGQEKDL